MEWLLLLSHCWAAWVNVPHQPKKNEAQLDHSNIPIHVSVPLWPYTILTWNCTWIQRRVQGKTSRNIYLIKFKTFQATGNPVNNQNRNGCRVVLFFPMWGFYLKDPLCITAMKQKKGGENGSGWATEGKKFSTEEVCHLLIVREVLNKKDLGSAESRLFQRGWVGVLFGGKAWQNTAREVCDYLKLLRGFFQWEHKVVDDLRQGNESKKAVKLCV